MKYIAPPPKPVNVEFSFNYKQMFSQKDIDDIMYGFQGLITRSQQFMEDHFKGATTAKIHIIKNFHYDEPENIKPNDTEHINCRFISDEKPSVTTHVYFSKKRTKITQMSKLQFTKYE